MLRQTNHQFLFGCGAFDTLPYTNHPEPEKLPFLQERQKNEVEEMYRILFEHPLVEAITGWDFADGAWLGAPSGVIRKDNSVKPVYNRLKEMIKGEWWTVCEICTDENGFAEVEGFKGDYIVEDGENNVSMKLDGTQKDVVEIIM